MTQPVLSLLFPRVATERLQASEEAFQAQVASRERAVEEQLQQLVREKEREATQAHQKVCGQSRKTYV